MLGCGFHAFGDDGHVAQVGQLDDFGHDVVTGLVVGQVALSMLLSALAHNRIDNKSAGLLLYGLQVASANAKTLGQQSDAPTVSETILDDTGQELALDEDPAEIAQDTTRIGFTENLLNELLLRSAADLIATLIDQLEPHDPAAAIVARKQAAPFHLNEVAGNGPPPSPAT